MLPTTLRILIILAAALALLIALRKVQKEKMLVEDVVFWIASAAILLVLAIFPEIAIWLGFLLGFQSATNFVYLSIIALLIFNAFSQALEISRLKYKISELAHVMALDKEKGKPEEKRSDLN